MPNEVAVDTDVLLKAAAYRLASELIQVLEGRGLPAVLGLTHLIASRQLARKSGMRDRDGAHAALNDLLSRLGSLEPDDGEVALAADFATAALERDLPLDTGEAQLVAIVMRRNLPLLVTGDKRALAAIGALVGDGPMRPALIGKLACLEQVIEAVADLIGEEPLRARICAEPDVDGAMRLTFSCGHEFWDPRQVQEACASFVAAVREQTGDLLADSSPFA